MFAYPGLTNYWTLSDPTDVFDEISLVLSIENEARSLMLSRNFSLTIRTLQIVRTLLMSI